MIRNIAIILAGGTGSRLGLSTPKQFFKVAGKMVVEHTVDAFESNPHIDEIALVSNPLKKFSKAERKDISPASARFKPMREKKR